MVDSRVRGNEKPTSQKQALKKAGTDATSSVPASDPATAAGQGLEHHATSAVDKNTSVDVKGTVQVEITRHCVPGVVYARDLPEDLWTQVFGYVVPLYQPLIDFNPHSVVRIGRDGKARLLPKSRDVIQDLRLINRTANQAIVTDPRFWQTIHVFLPISTVLRPDQLTEHLRTLAKRGRGSDMMTLHLSLHADFATRGFLPEKTTYKRDDRPGFYAGTVFAKSRDGLASLFSITDTLVVRGFNEFRMPPITTFERLRQLELYGVIFKTLAKDPFSPVAPTSLIDILTHAPLIQHLILEDVNHWYDSDRDLLEDLSEKHLRKLARNLRTIYHGHRKKKLYHVLEFFQDVQHLTVRRLTLEGDLRVMLPDEGTSHMNLDEVEYLSLHPTVFEYGENLAILRYFSKMKTLEITNPTSNTMDLWNVLDCLGWMTLHYGDEARLNRVAISKCTVPLYDLANFISCWITPGHKNLELSKCSISFGMAKGDRAEDIDLYEAARAGYKELKKAGLRNNVQILHRSIQWLPTDDGVPLSF